MSTITQDTMVSSVENIEAVNNHTDSAGRHRALKALPQFEAELKLAELNLEAMRAMAAELGPERDENVQRVLARRRSFLEGKSAEGD